MYPNEQSVVQQGHHETSEEGLLRPDNEGRVLLHRKPAHQKPNQGLHEHVDPPRAVGHVQGQAQPRPRQRAAPAPLPQRVPPEEEEHGVGVGAVDPQAAHDEPLQPKHPNRGKKSTGRT